jgi:tetratricopeptide (TPR) repeat protein
MLPMPEGAGPAVAEGRDLTRLDRLSPEQHRILAYASAIGPEFDFPLLVAAMGLEEEALAERLEELVHQGILTERAGGDRFAFAEESSRARIYRSLTESRMRVLHRKVAEAMERAYPDPPLDVVAELGRHFFLGKVPEKSRRYNHRASDAARAADDPEAAAHFLQRVEVDLEALPGDQRHDLAEIDTSLGELYYQIGNFTSADRYFTSALGRLGSDEPRIRGAVLLARAEIARENLDVDSAARQALEAQGIFESVGDRLGRAQTFRLLGRLAFQRGEYHEALDQNMRALDAIGEAKDPRMIGRLAIDIGNSFALLGSAVTEEGVAWYDRAIDRLERVGDWVELSRAYHNRGVLIGQSHPQDGLDDLDKARDLGERAHDSRSTGRALLSGVEFRLALGQLEEAKRDNEQAGRLLERLADDLGLEQVEVNRGLIAEKQGQWEDAERAFDAALAICRRFRLPADEAEVHFFLARLRFKTRDLERAREELAAAERLGVTEMRPALAPGFAELKGQLAPQAEARVGTTADRLAP